jgi:dTDP-glucose 4,6-dehydratase
MKLLVTGGAGFIGSNFIRHILSRRGFQVVNFDLLTYAGNLQNLAGLEAGDDYRFIRGDIASREQVAGALDPGIDAIVHFAAESHVDRSILDASAFVRTNVLGTQNLLETARREGISRFIQVSTDEVYGSLPGGGKFTEDSPLAPNSPYAASKAAADLLARAYHRTYGLAVVTTRCGNNYGPHQFPEKLIPLMVSNALDDEPLPLYGDGLYTRDWIHVLDHCRALEAILLEGRDGAVYNIGADGERTNLEVARRILGILGKSEDLISFVADRPAHDRRYAVDSSRLRLELGWSPRIRFEEGLDETVRWYRDHPQWVDGVRSGDYRLYYRKVYGNRDRTLSSL